MFMNMIAVRNSDTSEFQTKADMLRELPENVLFLGIWEDVGISFKADMLGDMPEGFTIAVIGPNEYSSRTWHVSLVSGENGQIVIK